MQLEISKYSRYNEVTIWPRERLPLQLRSTTCPRRRASITRLFTMRLFQCPRWLDDLDSGGLVPTQGFGSSLFDHPFDDQLMLN